MRLPTKQARKFNKVKFPVVKACAGAILVKNNKILLTKRNVIPEKNKWCLPGGHIDIGEKAVEAIKRKVKEETGLALKNPKFLFYFNSYIPKRKIHSIDLCFTGLVSGKEKLNKEVSEIKWLTKKQALKLNLSFNHRKMINKFLKIER
ncbi:NUDIX hydrolase [Candidatus Pacearchaeota archaeon]|nr:NUDIX hydrolase [Candidatus Pacearchaeota archaeon]